ncbi:ATP-dependent endonuclease [TM7 phylum sp. oral taxon 349]|nr:ATP-dependent endonuclease [TM7 phylum sp. oral taxon 349]
MKQSLALEILLSGESALLTGPAGTGKTFVLNQFIRASKDEGKYVSVTATTGLAATHLGGTTIHAWAGIGVLDYLPDRFVDHIAKGRREIIEKTDILIIDEISMLHDYRLDMVDEVCRLVRKAPDVPFGGIQVVMSGDFFQLPPVNRAGSREGGFVVHSDAWRELNPVILYLNEQFRQREGDALLDILTSLRANDLRRHHAEKLLERTGYEPPTDADLTELHTMNVDVDQINGRRLAELAGDEVQYTQHTTGSANYVENLQRSVLAPVELVLKLGALVMAVKNDQSKRYANGSIGMVVDFEPATDYPVVQFRNGRMVVMQPDTWELRDGDKKRASISQVPLRLAWAITVHKSQGMTLDAARIDLRKAFVPGMGYVALSRVRDIDNLYLTGINRTALQMSDEAYAIDERLKMRAANDRERFQYLQRKAEERAAKPLKNPSKKKSSSWSEKIAKMREIHPNAYKPWQPQDDEALKLGFINGESIKHLSTQLGRHEGSIRMRLQKHFGEDAVQ